MTSSAKKQQVTSQDVTYFMTLKEKYKDAQDKADKIALELAEIEKVLIDEVSAGITVNVDGYAVAVKETARRCPSWKTYYIAVAGKDAAESVIEATEPTISRHLVVTPTGLRLIK